MKYSKITLLFFLLHFVFAANSQTTITLNGNGSGRTFEGVGILSGGGGNSKLLKDYIEPYRSQVLDYLFKPKFGASFKELKVEIGADINSTSGTEPSHARTLAENSNPNMTRGYETWLIDQAKKRNPNITLYGLQWGAPGWIGSMWSQNNADYLVSYIKGLKSVWGYDMDYIGGNQNESYNGTSTQARNYIVNILRPTLNNNGLSNVKIVAPDILSGDWAFASKLSSDASLKNSVSALGYHYVNSTTNTTALNCGLPLWESEGWTGVGNWEGAYALAKEINLNYIKGKITKTDIWHMINSQYNNVNWPHSGIMEANAPWSGWYLVSPSVWIVAHTNQFAEAGWKYIDSGCGITSKGNSYVTFKNPNDSNYSVVIVDTLSESMTFNLSGGLSRSVVHVWKSTKDAQFVKLNDITPVNDSFTINLYAGAIYSLTTTTGQQKGDTTITMPEIGSIGENYQEDFGNYEIGATPKYTYDIYGAFEVQNGTDTKVLRQVITGTNLEWNVWGDYPPGNPFTEFGDLRWQNYDYSADVRIETAGSACIYGRVGQALEGRNVSDFKGYRLAVKNTGDWSLCYGNCGSYETSSDVVLASGTISGFDANGWHNLKLSLNGDSIGAYIDNVWKNTVYSNERCIGMAGLGSGFNYAQFDNISIVGKARNSNDSIISGATYIIKNAKSGKVLSPLNGSGTSGTNIVQVTHTGDKTQEWLLTNLDNGYWSIKNASNGLSMDIDGYNGSSTADGAYNIQQSYSGANSQHWNLKNTGCNFNIINRNSAKYLDISGGSLAENAQDIQWPSNGGKNQQWEFIKVMSTGVNPIKGAVGVEVYPNPATDYISLKYSNISVPVQMKIVNNIGQSFWTGVIKNDSMEKIDISKFPHGFYIVYTTSNVVMFSKKLIIE